jgi:signal transduction histidine kinase
MMQAGGPEGTGVTRNSEGAEVFTAYTRAPHNGWITAVGLPVSGVEANARQSFATFGGGVALSIVLGRSRASHRRSIAGPMARLSEAATRARGTEGAHLVDTDVREIQDVARRSPPPSRARARRCRARGPAAHASRRRAPRPRREPRQGRVPRDARPRAAQSAGRDLQRRDAARPTRVDEAREDARSIIARQVGHLTRLTDDLLDAGARSWARSSCNAIPSTSPRGARSRSRRSRPRDARSSTWSSRSSSRVGRRRPIRVDQIVSNLVVNAAKYSPAGSRIRVSVRREGRHAVLRVADDGIGVPAELAPRVFDLFVQGDRELDRALGGLGIGLTLVRRLARCTAAAPTCTARARARGAEFIVRCPRSSAGARDGRCRGRAGGPAAIS